MNILLIPFGVSGVWDVANTICVKTYRFVLVLAYFFPAGQVLIFERY